jgi:hypothetical protein
MQPSCATSGADCAIQDLSVHTVVSFIMKCIICIPALMWLQNWCGFPDGLRACVQNLRRRDGARAIIPSPHDDPTPSVAASTRAHSGVHTHGHAGGARYAHADAVGSGQVVAVVQTTSDWDRVDPQLAAAVQSGTCLLTPVMRAFTVALWPAFFFSGGGGFLWKPGEGTLHFVSVLSQWRRASTVTSQALCKQRSWAVCCAGAPVPPVAVADPAMHAPMRLKGTTQRLQRCQQQLTTSLSNYSYMHHPGRLQMINAMLPGCTSVPAFVPIQGSEVCCCSTVHAEHHACALMHV